MGSKQLIADCLEGLAALASQQDQARRAASLFGATHALRRSIGAPSDYDDPGALRDQRDAAREELGEEAFGAAWAEGEAMTLEEAVAFALKEGLDG
jgi:hypothetical protein